MNRRKTIDCQSCYDAQGATRTFKEGGQCCHEVLLRDLFGDERYSQEELDWAVGEYRRSCQVLGVATLASALAAMNVPDMPHGSQLGFGGARVYETLFHSYGCKSIVSEAGSGRSILSIISDNLLALWTSEMTHSNGWSSSSGVEGLAYRLVLQSAVPTNVAEAVTLTAMLSGYMRDEEIFVRIYGLVHSWTSDPEYVRLLAETQDAMAFDPWHGTDIATIAVTLGADGDAINTLRESRYDSQGKMGTARMFGSFEDFNYRVLSDRSLDWLMSVCAPFCVKFRKTDDLRGYISSVLEAKYDIRDTASHEMLQTLILENPESPMSLIVSSWR